MKKHFKQRRSIKVLFVLFIFLILFSSQAIGQNTEVRELTSLEKIYEFLQNNVIILLVTTILGAFVFMLNIYEKLKKSFPKWFTKKTKSFKSKDKEFFKILIGPARNYSESDELLDLMAIRFKRMHEDENLNVIVKRLTHGDFIQTNKEAINLGKKYGADLVMWVDYFENENETQIHYAFVPENEKLRFFIKLQGIITGSVDFSKIKTGVLLGDIDDLVFGVLGTRAYYKKKYQEALVLLEKVKIKSYKMIGTLGNCAHYLEKHEEALKYYEEAVLMNPEYASGYSGCAISLECLGRLEEVEECFKRSLEFDEESANTRLNYANFLRRANRFEEATFHYEYILFHNPEFERIYKVYNSYANLLKRQGKLIDALYYYEEGISRSKQTNVIVYTNSAICCYHLIDHKSTKNRFTQKSLCKKGIRYAEEAIKIDSNYSPAYNILGLFFQFQNKFDKAEEKYQKAINIKKDYAQPYLNLADLYMKMNKLNEAYKKYKKAISIDPSLQTIRRDKYFLNV